MTLIRSLRASTRLQRAFASMRVRHKEASIIASLDDEAQRPTERLLDVALGAASRARTFSFHSFAGRSSNESRWFDVWPGEHYKLLAALVLETGAQNVVEVGTFTGMGTVALMDALPATGTVTTFDIVGWRDIPDTWLTEQDFAGGRVRQEIADIARPNGIAPHRHLFEAADFIFLDGPKDGVAERKFIDALASLSLPRNPIVMFDDVRVLNMVAIWRQLDRPKLDLTSFGHWSGTGLVDWNG